MHITQQSPPKCPFKRIMSNRTFTAKDMSYNVALPWGLICSLKVAYPQSQEWFGIVTIYHAQNLQASNSSPKKALIDTSACSSRKQIPPLIKSASNSARLWRGWDDTYVRRLINDHVLRWARMGITCKRVHSKCHL